MKIFSGPVPLEMSRDGVALVQGTRVPLDTIVDCFRSGPTPEEIVQRFPTLGLSDVYAIIAFYLRNLDDVEDYLRQRLVQRGTTKQESELRLDPQGIRDRLLARRAVGGD
ncbi:MAG: DUF433 domain-containing protein [Vulcanimicrobiota bacterium]